MSDDRVYTGRGSIFDTQYGQAFKVQVTLSELAHAIKCARERDWTTKFTRKDGTEEEQIDLVFFPAKEPQKWRTHYGQLNEPYRKEETEPTKDVDKGDDLPF